MCVFSRVLSFCGVHVRRRYNNIAFSDREDGLLQFSTRNRCSRVLCTRNLLSEPFCTFHLLKWAVHGTPIRLCSMATVTRQRFIARVNRGYVINPPEQGSTFSNTTYHHCFRWSWNGLVVKYYYTCRVRLWSALGVLKVFENLRRGGYFYGWWPVVECQLTLSHSKSTTPPDNDIMCTRGGRVVQN